MPTQTANKAIAIFFLVFALGLAVFIVTQGIDLYQGTRQYEAETTEPSIDCIKFFYEISGIEYELGELSFRISNLDYSEDFVNVTVNGRTLPVSLPRGSSQQLRVGADIASNFTVYPGTCSVYATTCFLDSGECVRSQ